MTGEILESVEVVEVEVDVEDDGDGDGDGAKGGSDDEEVVVVADVVSADNHRRQREMHTRLICGGRFHRNRGRKIGGCKSSDRIRVGRRRFLARIKGVHRIGAIPVPIPFPIPGSIAIANALPQM